MCLEVFQSVGVQLNGFLEIPCFVLLHGIVNVCCGRPQTQQLDGQIPNARLQQRLLPWFTDLPIAFPLKSEYISRPKDRTAPPKSCLVAGSLLSPLNE